MTIKANQVFFVALFCLCFSALHSQNEKIIDSFLNVLKIAKEDTNQVNTLKDLGNLFYSKGDYAKAMENYSSSLLLSRNIGFRTGEARAYGNIGIVYRDQGNYPEAIKNILISLKMAEEIGNKRVMANAYQNIGIVYSMQGNHPESLKNYLAALKIREEIGDKQGIAGSYSNIGIVYTIQGNLEAALKNHLEALKIQKEIGDKTGLIRVYTNIGIIYEKQANYSEALNNFFAGLKISEEIGNKQGKLISYGNLGNLYNKLGNYTEALENQLSALKISEEIGEKFRISLGNVNIADVYNNMAKNISKIPDSLSASIEKYNHAIQYSNRGLLLAKEINAKEWIRIAYVNLSDSHRGLGNYKKALEYSDLSRQLKDSMFNDESTRKMEQLKTKYEVERAVIEEKTNQEKAKIEMQFAFAKREDSLKYQQELTQVLLDLSNKQNDINKLAYLNSRAELEAEQSRLKDKEQRLTISEQEKFLQNNQLTLQQTQLNLKESQIQAQKKQLLFYASGIILLILLFVFTYRNIKNRQRADKLIAAERLKSEKVNAAHKMAELELQSLRAQLNPHFMFNSLNAIQELILKEDNDNSHLYLSRFSDLLRMLLENANHPFIPLRKELNLLELYLSLENLRIPDLNYSIEVDPLIDSNKISIPNMMLQPYIENAIWHGLSHKKGERNVNIRIIKNESGIVCEVKDDGVGRKMATQLKSLYRKEHRSRGMELLSKRFSLLSKEYGSEIHTKVEDLHDNGTATGTRVAITVPYSLTEQPQPLYS